MARIHPSAEAANHAVRAPWRHEQDFAPGIEIRESTINETALDPELCRAIPRQSGPAYEVDGAPNACATTEAFAGGEWTVIAAEDGWFGWTPNHRDEAKQSPAL